MQLYFLYQIERLIIKGNSKNLASFITFFFKILLPLPSREIGSSSNSRNVIDGVPSDSEKNPSSHLSHDQEDPKEMILLILHLSRILYHFLL